LDVEVLEADERRIGRLLVKRSVTEDAEKHKGQMPKKQSQVSRGKKNRSGADNETGPPSTNWLTNRF